MDSPESAPRSRRRLILGIGAVVVVVLLLVAATFLPGPEPDGGGRVCREHVIGPVGAALCGPRGPWPKDWAELLAAPSSAALGMEGAMVLRCPDDPDPADPLASPSIILVTGLERDMPPQLVACYERACFHIASSRGNVSFARLWFVTLGGQVDYFAIQVTTPEAEAEARRLVLRSMQSLVSQDARGIALAGRRPAVAAGDADAVRLVREGLRAGNHRMRLCAAWTAGAAGNGDLLAPLLDAFRAEREVEVREEMARSLAQLGDRTGLPLLLSVFEAPAPVRGNRPSEPATNRVRRARAHDGLVALAGSDQGGLFEANAVQAWKAWAKP